MKSRSRQIEGRKKAWETRRRRAAEASAAAAAPPPPPAIEPMAEPEPPAPASRPASPLERMLHPTAQPKPLTPAEEARAVREINGAVDAARSAQDRMESFIDSIPAAEDDEPLAPAAAAPSVLPAPAPPPPSAPAADELPRWLAYQDGVLLGVARLLDVGIAHMGWSSVEAARELLREVMP